MSGHARDVSSSSKSPAGAVIVLNGGSSAGKTTIARTLQHVLPGLWTAWSIDDLVAAMPRREDETTADIDGSDGIAFGPGGEVEVGPAFIEAMAAWRTGLAAMVRAGASIVVDDVFLGGGDSQDDLSAHLDGLDVLWVGVRCDPETAAGREAARGDRPAGMARSQAESVHAGVSYDVEVDSGRTSPADCALAIADALGRRADRRRTAVAERDSGHGVVRTGH